MDQRVFEFIDLNQQVDVIGHNSFVACARLQKNIVQLVGLIGAMGAYLEEYYPDIREVCRKASEEFVEEEWPEIARKFGYSVLSEREGGLGEYPDDVDPDNIGW